MKERIFDILLWLMSEMRNKAFAEIDLADLKDKGYTQSEINAAFTWIEENVLPLDSFRNGRAPRSVAGSRRVFHAAEKNLLTTESQGYLIQLSELGVLDDREFEAVMERAMASGYDRITVEELRDIIPAVLLSRGGNTGPVPGQNEGGETIH